MKCIAVEKDYTLNFIDIPVPRPDDCSALVKINACGICGTDLKIIHGTFKGFHDYPCLLGHEAVGEVIEIGKYVEEFKVGNRVILPYIDDKVNGYQTIFGAFAEYGIVHDWHAMAKHGKGPMTPGFNKFFYTQKKLPDDFDPVNSVMIVTLREVLGAVRHFDFKPNESLVIFGGGSVGLSFAKFAKIIGMRNVILVDIADAKIERAKKLGVDYAFNSQSTDVVKEIRKICPQGVDYTLDAVGVNSLFETAMKLIRLGGKMLVYGISSKLSMNLNWEDAPNNWSMEYFWEPVKEMEAEVHEQLLQWISMGIIDPGDFVSHVFSFDEALKGFEILEKRLPADKIVIKISE